MNSIITTGNFAAALFPGVKTWYGREYNEFPEQWSRIFDKDTSRRAFEEDVSISSFGLVNVMPEGQPVNYDTEQQGFLTRYTHIKYGLGFIITKEMVEDKLLSPAPAMVQ